MNTFRKPNEQYFPNRRSPSYLNLTKTMITNVHEVPTAQKVLNTKT